VCDTMYVTPNDVRDTMYVTPSMSKETYNTCLVFAWRISQDTACPSRRGGGVMGGGLTSITRQEDRQ